MDRQKYSFSMGSFSLDIEGSEEFIKSNFDSLLKKSLEAVGSLGGANLDTSSSAEALVQATSHNFDETLSTNTIALSTNVKTGSELVVAAIAQLQLVQGASKVSRQEIAAEIKTATTFYKTTYTSNLSAYLESLLKSRKLNLVAKDTYSLTASAREELTDALRNAS